MDIMKLKFDEVVAEMLLKIGITPDLIGFHYIIDCTYVIIKKHCRIRGMINDVYAVVAEEKQTKISRIINSIVHALDTIDCRDRICSINDCFGVRIFERHDLPTNNQFLMILADRISRLFYFNDENGTLTPIG